MLMRKLGRTGLRGRRSLSRRQYVRVDHGPEGVGGRARRLSRGRRQLHRHRRRLLALGARQQGRRVGDGAGHVDVRAQEPVTPCSSPPRSWGRWGRARTTPASRASTSWKASRPRCAGCRPTTSTSTRRTGTIATRRSRRRCAPSTTSWARARCAISAPRTTSAWRLTRALWESDKRGYARYESLQPKYNLVFRDEYERELEPLCLEQGVGVIPYSSLGQRLPLRQVSPRRGSARRPRAPAACRRAT